MNILRKIGAIGTAVAILLSTAQLDIKANATTNICGIEIGGNIENQDYEWWATTIKSYLTSCGAELMRVQVLSDNSVWAEYYDTDYNLLSVKQIPAELPIFGGFYAGNDGNYYIISGATNYSESNSAEVFRITKYDSNWNRISSVSLYGANTVEPFSAGTARFAEYNDYLVIHTCHKMYMTSDGLNHQANVMIQLDMSSMKITDSFTDIMNIDFGYVSHSFNQFVEIDGGHIISLNHGDMYPRSLIIGRYTSSVTTGKFINGTTIFNYSDILNIPSSEVYQHTGVSVGGFEISDSGYLTAINSVDINSYNPYVTRDVYVIHTAKSGSSFSSSTVKQITTGGGYNTPRLVKISNSKFVLLWSKDNTVYYTSLDGNVNMTSSVYSLSGNLSDCAPIISGGKIVWYAYENADVTFYEISTSDLSQNNAVQVIAGHDFEYVSTANGVAKFKCKKCGKSETKTVPTEIKMYGKTDVSDPYFYRPMPTELQEGEKLYILANTTPTNAENNELEVVISDETILSYNEDIGALLPKGNGETQVTFRVKYNPEIAETYTINVTHEHIYDDEWTVDKEATCEEKGSKSKHCIICDEKAEITEIPMVEHKFSEEFITERKADCSKTGLKYRVCEACGEQTDITEIPKTEHDFETEIIAPTYEEEGYTLSSCKNCYYSEKSDFVAKLVEMTTMVQTTVPITTTTEEITTAPVTTTTTAPVATSTTETTTAMLNSVPDKVRGVEIIYCGTNDLCIEWDVAPNVEGYIIKERINGEYVKVARLHGNGNTQYLRNDLKPGTTYSFKFLSYIGDVERESVTLRVDTMFGDSNYDYIITTADATLSTPQTTAAPITTSANQTTTTTPVVTTVPLTTTEKTTTTQPPVPVPEKITGVEIVYTDNETIQMEWDKADSADGYIVQEYRSGNWTDIKKIEGTAYYGYSACNLAADTEYRFRVCCYIDDIRGEYTEFTARTLPNAPTGTLTVSVSNVTQTSADVSWNSIAGASEYQVQLFGDKEQTITVKGTSYTFTNLIPDTCYLVSVSAVNEGGVGTRSAVDFNTLCNAPNSVGEVTIYLVTSDGAIIGWIPPEDKSGLKGFIIENITTGGSFKSNSPSTVINGLNPNTTYNFRVCAYTDGGNSEWMYFSFTTLAK